MCCLMTAWHLNAFFFSIEINRPNIPTIKSNIKLKEAENAWKPSFFRKDENATHDATAPTSVLYSK